MDTARKQIEDWRSTASGATVVSASAVQDRLFDLWGELQDRPQQSVVEQWLTLTVERELFTGKELVDFLNELDDSLTAHSAN